MIFARINTHSIWVSRHQKGKTNLDLLEQEIVRGSISNWIKVKEQNSGK